MSVIGHMISGLTTGIREPIRGLIPGGSSPSLWAVSSCVFFFGSGTPWDFPIPLYICWCCHCWNLVEAAALLRYHEHRRHSLTSDFLVLWLLQSFHLFHELQLLYWRSWITDVCNGTSLPIINWSLHSFWVTSFTCWLTRELLRVSWLHLPSAEIMVICPCRYSRLSAKHLIA